MVVTVTRYFSRIFFQFAWDRFLSCPLLAVLFPSSFPSVAHSLLDASSFGIFVHFNFLRSSLLLSIFTHFIRITSYPQNAFHLCSHVSWNFYSLIYIFLNSIYLFQFEPFAIFPSCSIIVTPLFFAHSFQSSVDLLILSIYLISLFFFISTSCRRVSLFTHCPMFLGADNIKALHLLSFHPLRVHRFALPILFPHSFSPRRLYLSPTNMYSLLLAFTTSRTFYASFSPLPCPPRISISAPRGCNPSLRWMRRNVL